MGQDPKTLVYQFVPNFNTQKRPSVSFGLGTNAPLQYELCIFSIQNMDIGQE